MDIIWLRDFESLVAQKNFSRAAEERNVSQPAFSRRIRALEDEVGVKLIDRQTLPLSLTPAGEVFLSQARVMLRTYEETLERCQVIDASNDSVIRFATTQSLYMTHFKWQLEPLVQEGGLDIDLNSTGWASDQFVTALQQRYCDVILTFWHPAMDFLSPLEVSKCDYITLARDELIPVSKAGPDGPMHVLESGRKKSVPFLSYGAVSALNPVVEHLLRQAIDPPSIFVINRNALASSVKAMILEGFGLGWLPRAMCRDELQSGTLQIAGEALFSCPLEVRLYRDRENSKASLEKLWLRMKEISPQA